MHRQRIRNGHIRLVTWVACCGRDAYQHCDLDRWACSVSHAATAAEKKVNQGYSRGVAVFELARLACLLPCSLELV